jgi:hypothetical protein
MLNFMLSPNTKDYGIFITGSINYITSYGLIGVYIVISSTGIDFFKPNKSKIY